MLEIILHFLIIASVVKCILTAYIKFKHYCTKKIVNQKLGYTTNIFSGFSALLLGLGLVFVVNVYGFDIIQFIFQRGAFTLDDTIATLAYAKDLSYSFVLIFLASALFQPFLLYLKIILK